MKSVFRVVRVLAVATFFLASAWSTKAAVSLYLTISGIPGDSLVSGLSAYTGISGFTFSASTNTPGNPLLSITVQKNVNVASPTLAYNCASGGTNASATIACYKAGGSGSQVEFYYITFTDVHVASVSVSGGSTLTESVTFTFSSIQWSYSPQNADGSLGTPIVKSFP